MGHLDQIPLPDAHVQLVRAAARRSEVRLVLAAQDIQTVMQVVQPGRRGGGVLVRRRFQLHRDLLQVEVRRTVRLHLVLVALVRGTGVLAIQIDVPAIMELSLN